MTRSAERPRAAARAREEPVRQFFSIGDVCTLTGLKPHVLRYWETQFRFLSPAKNRSGNRVYQRREVELILLVKHLLYSEKYTIEGARRKVDEHRKTGGVRTMSRVALERETLEAIERELAGLVGDLSLAADRPLASRTVALTRDWNEGSAAESG
jgi:DNA-binding transcriptional MerR regulator